MNQWLSLFGSLSLSLVPISPSGWKWNPEKPKIMAESRNLGHTSTWKPPMLGASGSLCWEAASFCCSQAHRASCGDWPIAADALPLTIHDLEPFSKSFELSRHCPALKDGLIAAQMAYPQFRHAKPHTSWIQTWWRMSHHEILFYAKSWDTLCQSLCRVYV